MVMFKRALLFIGCILLWATPAVSQQSDGFVPYERLYVTCEHPDTNDFTPFVDVCSWQPGETELERETTSAYISELAISPDGTKIVYLALPDDYVDAVRRGEDPTRATDFAQSPDGIWASALSIGWYPTNIGVMDLTVASTDAGRFTTIAEQHVPADSTLLFQQRALPIWSPDSTRVAWFEEDFDEVYGGNIVVYDTRTDTSQIIAEQVGFGWRDGGDGYSIPSLRGWGSLIAYTTYDADVYPAEYEYGFGTTLWLYDMTGEVAAPAISYFTSYDARYSALMWTLHHDVWRVAIDYPDPGWVAFDPLNDTYELLENPPYVSAVTGMGWTGILIPATYPQAFEWQLDGQTVQTEVGAPLTFDPDGNPIWRDADGRLVTIGADGLRPILPQVNDALGISAVWTPMVWQTDGLGTAITPTITALDEGD